MAFSKEAKAKWRQRPEVRAYNKAWREANRQHVSEYNRAYHQRRSRGGGDQSTTTAPVQVGLVDE
jgi:hypothetical protein